MTRYLLVLGILISAAVAWAGRPLATEDAYVLGRNHLEVEVGVDYATEEDAGAALAPAVGVTYGLLSLLDVAAGVPVAATFPEEGEGSTGLGDCEVGAKVLIYGREDSAAAVAFAPAVLIPTGKEEDGLGEGCWGLSGTAAVSFGLGPATLHVNAGYTHAIPEEGDAEGIPSAAAAVEFGLADNLSLAAEYLADLKEVEGDDGGYPMTAGGGLSWAVMDALALDAGASAGLGAADGILTITAGLTWAAF